MLAAQVVQEGVDHGVQDHEHSDQLQMHRRKDLQLRREEGGQCEYVVGHPAGQVGGDHVHGGAEHLGAHLQTPGRDLKSGGGVDRQAGLDRTAGVRVLGWGAGAAVLPQVQTASIQMVKLAAQRIEICT